MHQIKLKSATVEDIDTISKLAITIWNQHYTSIITQSQIDYMLNKMYSNSSLLDQIQTKKFDYFIIVVDLEEIGFLSVQRKNENEWFLSKFYLDQRKARKGIGDKVFQEWINLSKAQKISLTVNRKNFKAINFYFKLGFKISKIEDFDIGQGYEMNDFVMTWVISNPT